MKAFLKANIYLGAILLFSVSTFAKIITCNNNVLTAGQYSSLQTALNAANMGDTVYVAPSPTSYGDIVVNQRITLMGGGHDVNNSQFKYNSSIGWLRLDSIFSKTISGIRIQGLAINTDLGNNGSNPINNVTIERCALSCAILGSGWILKNNHLYNIRVNNNTNVIITNNIFIHNNTCCYANVRVSNNPSVLIANNIFLVPNFYNYYSPWDNVSYANIANNIFYYSGNVNTNCSLCNFTNNITFNDASVIATIPGVANTGGNNKNNVDPMFMNAPKHNSVYNATEAAYSDWRLQAGSPGKNAGSDNKDIGLYGGSYPPVNNSGIPGIPQTQTMNVNTAVVPLGGTLNVTFTAKKQQ